MITSRMLTTREARQTIADVMPEFPTDSVALAAAEGRILRQTVGAERDQPPFDRVTMDGIAIRHEAYAEGLRRFRIASTQHAGDPMMPVEKANQCAEVMTGTTLPTGTDTVIPVERIRETDGHIEIEDGYEPSAGQFIHRRGSDHRQGTELLQPGTRISSLEVAILASCGLADVSVSRLPRIRVISTGNELIPAGQAISEHQIRMSNGPALIAMLRRQGFTDTRHDHLADDPALLETRIAEHLASSNVLVLSGGVSMGKADFVPQVLKNLGVKKVFHRISQRPGKPMWFGEAPRGQVVFALPGNPVSSLVCCRQYVLPALLAASQRNPEPQCFARLIDAVSFKPELTFFLPVRINVDSGATNQATPIATNTSGDFTALGGTDGYVELPAEQSEFAAGQTVRYHAWDRP